MPHPFLHHVQQRGWKPDDPLAMEIITRLMGQQPVHIVQQAGSRAWLNDQTDNITLHDEVPGDPDPNIPLVIITDRLLGPRPEVERLVVLRPPTLTLGIASRRDMSLDELEEASRLFCRRAGYAIASVMAIAASSRRRSHDALDAYAEKLQVPLLLYDDAILRRTPWQAPGKMAGTCVVSAILAAGTREPLVGSTPYFGKLSLALGKRKDIG